MAFGSVWSSVLLALKPRPEAFRGRGLGDPECEQQRALLSEWWTGTLPWMRCAWQGPLLVLQCSYTSRCKTREGRVGGKMMMCLENSWQGTGVGRSRAHPGTVARPGRCEGDVGVLSLFLPGSVPSLLCSLPGPAPPDCLGLSCTAPCSALSL